MPLNDLSRRSFLKRIAPTLAFMAGSGLSQVPLRMAWAEDIVPPGKELIVVCSTEEKAPESILGITVSPPGSINAYEVATQNTFKVGLPFWGHTLSQHPNYPQRVFTFEKWGRRGALVDLETREVLINTEACDGNIFFGHATFIADGSILVTSEDSYQRHDGQLVLRDSSNLKVLHKTPSCGIEPHECRTINNGKTLLVANSGPVPDRTTSKSLLDNNPPNLAWLEASSGKLLHKIPFDFMVGHVSIAPDGWILAGGSSQFWQKDFGTGTNATDGPAKMHQARAALISPEGRVIPLPAQGENGHSFAGETLSAVFLDQAGLVAYTLPDANRIYVWRYKTQELAGWVDVPDPKGIIMGTATQKTDPSFLVSLGKDRNHMVRIALSGQNHKFVAENAGFDFGGNGAHLVRIFI